jgi:hypothetical protein
MGLQLWSHQLIVIHIPRWGHWWPTDILSFISFQSGESLWNYLCLWFWEMLRMKNVSPHYPPWRTNCETCSQHVWIWLCTCMQGFFFFWKVSIWYCDQRMDIKESLESNRSITLFFDKDQSLKNSFCILSFLRFFPSTFKFQHEFSIEYKLHSYSFYVGIVCLEIVLCTYGYILLICCMFCKPIISSCSGQDSFRPWFNSPKIYLVAKI